MREFIYNTAIDFVKWLSPLMCFKFVLNYLRQFLFND